MSAAYESPAAAGKLGSTCGAMTQADWTHSLPFQMFDNDTYNTSTEELINICK